MTTTVVPNPPSAAVVLDGEMDIATCPAIRRFLMAAISGGDVHLAVDVSGVAFIDASGIGVLVAAANRARLAGGGLSLLAPSPQVRRLLDVLRLDAVLPIAERLAAPPVPAATPDTSPGPAARTKSVVVSCARADRSPGGRPPAAKGYVLPRHAADVNMSQTVSHRRSAGRGDDPVLVDLAVDRRPGHAQ
jgi:anti-anti-sigma factor